MRTLADVQNTLNASAEVGLTVDAVALSRRQFGVNRLTPLPRTPIWKKFLEKFDEPIIKILLAASLLKTVVDLFQGAGPTLGGPALAGVAIVLILGMGLRSVRAWLPALLFATALVLVATSIAVGHPSYDGLAVMVAVVLATGVAFLAEYRSDREFELLNEHKDAAPIKVIRGGEVHTVPVDDIVVGDLIVLEMGDEIPADGRTVRATEFYVDQSLMTGESEPVHKKPAASDSDGPESPNCLFRGTQVIDGAASMIVTEVGDDTMLGQLARAIGESTDDRIKNKLSISKDATPLQLKLQRLASSISRVGYAAAGLIFLALLIKGVIDGTIHWPRNLTDATEVARRLLDFFVIMVIIIVVAVPEGLPMSVTISLALAMRKMTRANSLVRQLVACETIGSATVICSDKTGTLTQNRMRVELVRFAAKDGVTSDRIIQPDRNGKPRNPADWLALISAVNSTARLEFDHDRLTRIGNTTEGALLEWLNENDVNYRQLRERYPTIYQQHFSSERKRMITVVEIDGRLIAIVKGAPEILLDRSQSWLDSGGVEERWSPERRQAIESELNVAAGQAMRTLAFGFAPVPGDLGASEDDLHARCESLDEQLVFIGFVAIRDPLRPDVKNAVAECRSAGIEVKMITGDNPATAHAIAADVGLIDRPDAVVLTSAEFNAQSDGELKGLMPRLRVLARARPLDKLRLVTLLQEQNQVVAMTGDGTNDAPSLKRADVGLAMGIAGTEVAKEASKIVLLDDSFATIVKAVHWGRALYENIQRFVQFQLTINVSALFIAFIAPFLGFGEPPFTVLQFLWINIIMDTFAAIALCSEPPREGLMLMPPKRRDEPILTPGMRTTILATAGFLVVVMCGLLIGMTHYGWFAGSSPKSDEFPLITVRQATIFFTVYVMFQVWNQINCRSLTPRVSGLSRLWSNPTFLLITGLIVLGQVVIVCFGGNIFKVEPLHWLDWIVIAGATASILVFGECLRWIRRSNGNDPTGSNFVTNLP